jgi:hypothetical protein
MEAWLCEPEETVFKIVKADIANALAEILDERGLKAYDMTGDQLTAVLKSGVKSIYDQPEYPGYAAIRTGLEDALSDIGFDERSTDD